MRRKIETLRRRLRGFPRVAAAVLSAVLLFSSLAFTVFATDVVTAVEPDGETVTTLSFEEEPGAVAASMLEQPEEEAAPQPAPAEVELRSFSVRVVDGGKVYSTEVTGGTVADLLAESGFELGEEDYVEPGLDAWLYDDLRVKVNRVTYREREAREAVPEADVAAYLRRMQAEDPDFTLAEPTADEEDGAEYDVRYRERCLNGMGVSQEIIELVPVVKPRPETSYTITPGVACSRIEGFDDIEMGPNGLPTGYTRVMSGAVTTAYSSSGGRGASGLGLYCGTVAVNPNVIPYGTRMFITSADGSFVYGFAIATDTGTALMEGIIDIDLYFETNAECLQFGKRPLDVYIFD